MCERGRWRHTRSAVKGVSDYSLESPAPRSWDVPRPARRVRRVCAIHHTELRESINPDRLQCETCGIVVDFDTVDERGRTLATMRYPDAKKLENGGWRLTSKGVRAKAQRRKK